MALRPTCVEHWGWGPVTACHPYPSAAAGCQLPLLIESGALLLDDTICWRACSALVWCSPSAETGSSRLRVLSDLLQLGLFIPRRRRQSPVATECIPAVACISSYAPRQSSIWELSLPAPSSPRLNRGRLETRFQLEDWFAAIVVELGRISPPDSSQTQTSGGGVARCCSGAAAIGCHELGCKTTAGILGWIITVVHVIMDG